MNRREFIYGSAAAATMNARSYAHTAGSNQRFHLGVIGLGRRGTGVSAAFLADPQVEIVAVCDVYDEQVSKFISRLPARNPKPRTYVRYEDLLANHDVDGVYIATPDHLHVTIATAALAAGKHVYLEKPTVHRWSDRLALAAAAAAHNDKVVQCGMQQRSGTVYLQAKQEYFDQRKLGDVVFVHGVWNDFSWQRRNIPDQPKPSGLNWLLFEGPAPHVPYETVRYSSWRYFPDYGYGLLADIMTHWIDVAQWLLDDPNPEMATSLGGIYRLHDQRVNPDSISAIVQYHTWNFNFESTVLPVHGDPYSVYFEGTEGALKISRQWYVFTPKSGPPVRFNTSLSLDQQHTKNFVDAVMNGVRLNAPLSAGLEASLPVQMALSAYWSHRIVSREELV